MDKAEIIREKEKIKKRYIGQVIFFSASLAVLSFLLVLSFNSKLNYVATTVLLIICSFVVPLAFCIVICILIKKEKKLKFVNVFLCSYQYILNLLFIATIYFYFYFKSIQIEDSNAIISFYSISWAILGITITLFGVWLSINTSHFLNQDKNNTFSVNQYNFNSIIGSAWTFASIVLNLIFLLSGVSYFSTGTYASHSSYYIGLIYISSYTILNMTTFLFFPTILEMISGGAQFNKSLLEYYGETIKIIELEETITDIVTLLNKLIDTIKNNSNSKDEKE